MKIAISGRGGVGKTTLCALLAETYAQRGRDVLAVDTDPSPSLAEALAVPSDVRSSLRPISEMDELIEERTGAKPGASGVFFALNPRGDDLPERFSVLQRGGQRGGDARGGRVGAGAALQQLVPPRGWGAGRGSTSWTRWSSLLTPHGAASRPPTRSRRWRATSG